MTYPLPILKDRPVLVLGLGKSGLAAVSASRRAGASDVIGFDNKIEEKSRIELEGVKVVSKVQDLIFHPNQVIIVSPGVPHSYPKPHPVISKTRLAPAESNVSLTSDIDLFFRSRSCQSGEVIGVSGTNGKSSTVSLINFILERLSHNSQMGGTVSKCKAISYDP